MDYLQYLVLSVGNLRYYNGIKEKKRHNFWRSDVGKKNKEIPINFQRWEEYNFRKLDI